MADFAKYLEPFRVHSEDGNVANRWKDWTADFWNVVIAHNIKEQRRQKALFHLLAGKEIAEIYKGFTDAQKGGAEDVERVIKSFEEYFQPQVNKFYEIHKFRQCVQLPNEGIQAYISRLQELARNCMFSDKDTEILIQIMEHGTSEAARRKILKKELTLEEMIKFIQAEEQSEFQARKIENKDAEEVNFTRRTSQKHKPGYAKSSVKHGATEVYARNSRVQKGKQGAHQNLQQGSDGVGKNAQKGNSSFRPKQEFTQRSTSGSCWRCGFEYPHTRTPCPAINKHCNTCGKKGHFTRLCSQRKAVRTVDEQESNFTRPGESNPGSDEEGQIFYINQAIDKNSTDSNNERPMVNVKINNMPIEFCADSGATVTVLVSNDFKKLKDNFQLRRSTAKVFPYGRDEPIVLLGEFDCNISFKGNNVSRTVYVAEGSESHFLSVLDYKACIDLGILKFVNTIGDSDNNIMTEFKDVFHGVGKLKDYKIKLHIDNNVQPVAQPHRRIPFQVRKQVEKKLEELEANDIIEKVEGPTPWVSPIVTVPKGSDLQDIRICVDMRQANKAIKRERHLTPTLDEIMADLNNSKVFSKLDLNQGYHQLELHEDSRYITTFSTHVGLRRYKRLSFGISSAAEIFQNVIRELLSDIKGATNIADDILIFAETQAEHDRILRTVLERLQSRNLTLNIDKCRFNKSNLNYFGYIFSEKGVSPDPKKVQAIKNAERPCNASEVRSFLGMSNYCSMFISDLSTISKPLRDLTKQDAQWKWGAAQEQSFAEIKNRLSGSEVMAYFDPRKDTTLIVDASPVGIGALLVQADEKGETKIINYASKSFSEVEQRYSQTEREALAIVYSIERFHIYLYGKSFKVITDHQPLVKIFNNPTTRLTVRLERWNLRLMPYDYTVIYKPGKSNPADYMSRHPVSQSSLHNESETEGFVNYIMNNAVPKSLSLEKIEKETKSDRTLVKVMEAIKSNKWDVMNKKEKDRRFTMFYKIRQELAIGMDKEIVLRGSRIVIPCTLEDHVIDLAHVGHQGIVKTKQLLREKVWFPEIDDKVQQRIRNCLPCQACTHEDKRDILFPSVLPDGPWEEISVDFCGPIHPSQEYLLVVIDDYSRYPVVEVVKSTAATTVKPALEKIFSIFGVPKVLKSDNGPPFQGSEFKNFSEEQGFHHRKITPLWPQANGEVERFMQTILKAIRTSYCQNKNWKSNLSAFLKNYRATPHSTTKKAPGFVMFKRSFRISLPEPLNTGNDYSVEKADESGKMKMKAAYEKKKRVCHREINVGDKVLVKNNVKGKLQPPFLPDPHVVVSKNNTMITAEYNGKKVTRNSSFFKLLSPDNSEEKPNVNDDSQEKDCDVPIPGRRRTQRDKVKPHYLNEYVI